MAGSSRDRVTIDLRGIGDAVRSTAVGSGLTVAALARQALVDTIGPQRVHAPLAALDRAERQRGVVKLTLRLREPDAEVLIINAIGLGLSYGEYVARMIRQTPLPMPATERAADRCPRT
jgi:hypothetical protein